MARFFQSTLLGVSTFLIFACDQPGVSFLSDIIPASAKVQSLEENSKLERPSKNLGSLINNSRAAVDVDAGFVEALDLALHQDPAVVAAKNKFSASKAKLRVTKTGGDTQINSTIMGGVEDVSDKTVGVAAVLSASRMLYDGGILAAKVDADTFYSKSAEQAYLSTHGERARKLLFTWIELERDQELKALIDGRLTVLDPLLSKLEEVATAGVGDVSQVAAAQRVVTDLLVTKNTISSNYQQSRISFINSFGSAPSRNMYESSWVSNLIPESSDEQLAEQSPYLLTKYWAYMASEASVVAVAAQGSYSVGLKMKLQQPFGGSAAASDESIGLVLSKTFYRGDQLTSQIQRAEEMASALAAEVSSDFRGGMLEILAARQLIGSMNRAIVLARNNAKSARKEIEYLRKQLIIGGSTLESVLAAESRLYDAESKEIDFIAKRRKAEASIATKTGHLTRTLIKN